MQNITFLLFQGGGMPLWGYGLIFIAILLAVFCIAALVIHLSKKKSGQTPIFSRSDDDDLAFADPGYLAGYGDGPERRTLPRDALREDAPVMDDPLEGPTNGGDYHYPPVGILRRTRKPADGPDVRGRRVENHSTVHADDDDLHDTPTLEIVDDLEELLENEGSLADSDSNPPGHQGPDQDAQPSDMGGAGAGGSWVPGERVVPEQDPDSPIQSSIVVNPAFDEPDSYDPAVETETEDLPEFSGPQEAAEESADESSEAQGASEEATESESAESDVSESSEDSGSSGGSDDD